jgi:hypothetical protein
MRLLPLLVMASIACVLSGCTDSTVNKDNGVVTYEVGAQRVSDTAAISGELTFVDGCLRFTSGTIPIFPADEVTWDGERLVLNGSTYRVGDTLELGGGETSRDVTSANVPARCGDGPLWAVSPESNNE